MILDEIVAHKRAEVAARKAMRSPAAVAVERPGPAAGFRRALSGSGLALIAEIKGASPSPGRRGNGAAPLGARRPRSGRARPARAWPAPRRPPRPPHGAVPS